MRKSRAPYSGGHHADVRRAACLSLIGLFTAATTAVAQPVVSFVDVQAGPVRGGPGGLGTPIGIFGDNFGTERGTSRVLIGGREVASYLAWGTKNAANPALDMIVVQPGPNVRGGKVTVEAGGKASASTQTFRPAKGRIFAVAPGGTDAARCTIPAPCLTIQHAIDSVLKPGDTLLVRGGPVADDEIWVRPEHGGTAARPITIRNYPGERPTLSKVTRPFIVSASHISVSGFDFLGGKSIGLGTETTTDVRLANSTFVGNLGFDAVGTHGDGVLVGGNLCDARGSSVGTQGHCFYISHGHGIRIVGNVGRGAPGYGIHIFDQERSSDDIKREITNVVVEGNTMSGSTERSGLIVAMGDEGNRGNHISGVTIRGNTFTGNNFAGVAIGGNVSGVRIVGNTFRNNGRQGVTIYDESTISDVQVTGNVIQQPKHGPCRSNCSWYPVTQVQVGAKAKAVVVRSNRLFGGP